MKLDWKPIRASDLEVGDVVLSQLDQGCVSVLVLNISTNGPDITLETLKAWSGMFGEGCGKSDQQEFTVTADLAVQKVSIR